MYIRCYCIYLLLYFENCYLEEPPVLFAHLFFYSIKSCSCNYIMNYNACKLFIFHLKTLSSRNIV